MRKILIADDDENFCHFLKKILTDENTYVETVSNGQDALDRIGKEHFNLLIIDNKMPGMTGLETFRKLTKIRPKLPVIIITAYGTADIAIEAMKLGAFDYVVKPFDVPQFEELVEKALEANRLMEEPVLFGTSADEPDTERIVGNSLKMQEVYKLIGKVAETDVTVLLQGESGTGKELVARAIYQHSRRKDGPFIVINCAAIPETLLESELFGYEKGAFTGASFRKIGKFEQCNGGTIFLDEVGDMSLGTQAKILRVLQSGEIERLGGSETIKVDVRIVAATNKNLEKAVKEGKFREDLYYRLNVVTINLPPLRERVEDIPELAYYFLRKFSSKLGKEMSSISSEAMEMLKNYRWPGNVRELENTIKRAIVIGRGRVLLPEFISFDQKPEGDMATSDEALGEAMDTLIENLLDLAREKNFCRDNLNIVNKMEELLIRKALQKTGGHQLRAARLLGISRHSLSRRIKKYNL
ncbi:MAG: sigma-54-dependent Fis family transcriptional regulator [Candidatus Latescibacterota bacterium]|nr:MAG: sigma-54-dependent Fis family transcriptional regulator [Candidatus Latescibacterota bacterium]